MKKPLVFLSLCSFFSAPVWAKVDCYDVKDLTFSSDKADQKGFTQTQVQGELTKKEDRKNGEITARYITTQYKCTYYDMACADFDRISTSAGPIAAYTQRMASLINSLRAYAIVSDRKLCFDTKSYVKPMTTIEEVKKILSVQGGVAEIRIPTKRLSIKNTMWRMWLTDEEDQTKERSYSYKGLVFDEKFVLARFTEEVATYVNIHLKKNRWWVVKMKENATSYNFKAFMAIDDCQFSDEKYIYLADIVENQPVVCGSITLGCSDPRYKKLLHLRSSCVTPREYTVKWQDKDPTLYLHCDGILQTTLTESRSLWSRLTTRKHPPRKQGSEAPSPELPPAYTETVTDDSK